MLQIMVILARRNTHKTNEAIVALDKLQVVTPNPTLIHDLPAHDVQACQVRRVEPVVHVRRAGPIPNLHMCIRFK